MTEKTFQSIAGGHTCSFTNFTIYLTLSVAALAHGDPHYWSFDSLKSVTTDGFGEYVLLWRSEAPAVMIQARHNKERPSNSSGEAKRTYIR